MPLKPTVNRKMAMVMRWLHIYLSMVSFAIVFFFAVTGLTLNHADRFQNQIHASTEKGKMNAAWTNATDTNKIDKLHIVEYLRETHGVRAALKDFYIDDSQIEVSFMGPGVAAGAVINRDNGTYKFTRTSAGFVGIINDLHKGRDTGKVWPVVIDISAVLLTVVSLTGMVLLLYLKKKRLAGLLVAASGLLLVYIIYKILF